MVCWEIQFDLLMILLYQQDFVPKLKNHLLSCLSGDQYNGDESVFTACQWNMVSFVQNQIYRHKVLRVNYTTYNLRRAQDALNPRTHADVMVLAHEDESEQPHPYWYARIIGIFHLNVHYEGRVRRMYVLWVRWLAWSIDTTSFGQPNVFHGSGFMIAATHLCSASSIPS